MSRKWCCLSLFPLLLAAIGVLLLTGPALASPQVDCNVPGEYATVADALADPVCDVINIDPGQYPENLVIDHDVTLAGAAANQTFLDGGGLDRVILITDTATVTITGVAITNGMIVTGAMPWGGGVYNYDGVLLLADSAIVSNTAYSGGGLLNDKGDVTLRDVTVMSNTAANVGGGLSNGAAMYVEGGTVVGNSAALNGGGIQNEGDMALVNITIARNRSRAGAGAANVNGVMIVETGLVGENVASGAGGGGGGFINSAQLRDAELLITGSRILGNQALLSPGGGGITNQAGHNVTATVTLRNSLIAFNVAAPDAAAPGAEGAGGGILNGAILTETGGTSYVDMQGVVVSNNTALNGGGIANASLANPSTTLRVDIVSSAIVSNSTLAVTAPLVGNGGGILNFNGAMRVINSTVSGNTANGTPPTATDPSGLGGGIANAGSLRAATVQLINTTVANNRANVAGGGVATLLAGAGAVGTGVGMANAIVAGNSALLLNGNCVSLPAAVPNLFASQGNNLEDKDTCNLTQTSDQKSTDPLLRPLAGNGGDTWTHALDWASPAIDAGSDAVCQTQVGGGDQRGWPRIVGNACDMGAYEASAWLWAPLIEKP